MIDLMPFLRARLDEDEQTARAAAWDEDMSARWRAGSTPHGGIQGAPRWYVEDAYEDAVVGRVDPQGSEDRGVSQHIARHDPARVLAEVDAKRQLLTRGGPFCTSRCDEPGNEPMDPDTDWTTPLEHHLDCAAYVAARVLALPYAGHHPDYREEWRPSTG